MFSTPRPPNLKTKRLILRQPRPGDEVALLPIRNTPRTLTAVNMNPSTLDRMRASLDQVDIETGRGTAYSAVVELSVSQVVIGLVRLEGALYGIRASLVVWVGHERPERGCGREAARAMIRWGFEQLALRAILAEVFGSNPASASLLSGLGFTEGVAEDRETHLGRRRVTPYSLSWDAWAAANASTDQQS